MERRSWVVAVMLAVVGCALAWPSTSASERPEGSAGAPLKKGWTEADKTGFGTARTRKSRVWFTLQAGRVSEIFYPDLSTPSVRSLQLTVDDGTTTDEQSTDMSTVVTRPDEGSLRFTQVSTDLEGRYRITQEVVTDPTAARWSSTPGSRPSTAGRYTLGVDYDPALGNGGEDDRGASNERTLVAVDQDDEIASALVASPTLESPATGRTATSSRPRRFPPRTARPRSASASGTAVGRRSAQAAGGAAASRGRPRGTTTTPAGTTTSSALKPVPAERRRRSGASTSPSALVLAAGEDKAHPGAFIASPSVPWVWGDEIKDLSDPSASYHEVWSRDLYQIGTALYAIGDVAAARGR